MSEPREPTVPVEATRWASWRTLNIMTLCSFAITQPLLTALSKQSVYLLDQQVGWIEIAALLATLLLLIPMVCVAIDRLFRGGTQTRHGVGRNLVAALLIALVCLSLLRPVLAWPTVSRLELPGMLAILIVIPLSWWLARSLDRSSGLQLWLNCASVGLIVFPGTFLWHYSRLHAVGRAIERGLPVEHPVPVVLIVFDEFSGITLMNERMELDAERFPHFARLGSMSTWYRNATTVHPRTLTAVPAILSGRYPTVERDPVAAQYPGNLLEVIEATRQYKMAVFETSTRLCPRHVARIAPPVRNDLEKCRDLLVTLFAVYPRLIFSNDVPLWMPPIPRPWFGLPSQLDDRMIDASTRTEGLFNYVSTRNRVTQFEHLLHCQIPSERPRFSFYHTVFPHYPWNFLPNGQQYQLESNSPYFPSGADGELGEDWRPNHDAVLRNEQRYRLQAGYADTLVGRLLDQLEASKLLDECLLIVMADHGVSFRPGHSRRLPDQATLAEIASIPLFIKLPRQTVGQIDDRNVETIDVLPTIAEVLGIQLPEPVDGIAVSQAERHPRKTFYFEGNMTVLEPHFPQRQAAVRRQAAIFGGTRLDQLPSTAGSHPEWHGRQTTSFPMQAETGMYRAEDPLRAREPDEHPIESQCVRKFLMGQIESSEPLDLLVAIDGVIVDSGTTFTIAGQSGQWFEFLFPDRTSGLDETPVEIYAVDRTQTTVGLRRLIRQTSDADAE